MEASEVQSRLDKCLTLPQHEVRLFLDAVGFNFDRITRASTSISIQVWWTFWRTIGLPCLAHNLVFDVDLIRVFMVVVVIIEVDFVNFIFDLYCW